MNNNRNILEVSDLSVDLMVNGTARNIVDGVSFNLQPGKVLALVGESGCGKSVTCMSLARLLDPAIAVYSRGTVKYNDVGGSFDVLSLDRNVLREFRASRIGYIFQEPSSCLNPVYKIRDQIAEVLYLAGEVDENEIEKKTVALLDMVGIGNSRQKLDCYPHELSGGMQQRVMIAMAVAARPSILVADEPTTALDVTIQAQIINLLKEIQEIYGMSVLLVTHNFGLVCELADEVMVMYAGRIVEKGSVLEIFEKPVHPYTRALIEVSPRLGQGRKRMAAIPGRIPEPGEYPAGCRFAPRCGLSESSAALRLKCGSVVPCLAKISEGHSVSCHGTF